MTVGERLLKVFNKLKLPPKVYVPIHKAVTAEIVQMVDEASDAVELMCVYILRTKYGFGEKRLNEFVTELNELSHQKYCRYELDTVIAMKHMLENENVFIDPISIEKAYAK